jgi:hypothetical protein
MVGILVQGNNPFILSGPSPDESHCTGVGATLVNHPNWRGKIVVLDQWEIKSKELREKLEWGGNRPGRA